MADRFWQSIARPLAFRFEAEQAHGLTIKALKSGLVSGGQPHKDKRLNQTIAGLAFDNPVGLAAGFDKNAEVPDAILKLGFGFTEVGTITPKAQPGNPRPRVFRLVHDQAAINRLGFNNEGHIPALERLKKRAVKPGILGVNVGANKDSDDRIADYVAGIDAFYDFASYFTVNISSPNTPGLRNLQAREQLSALLDRVMEKRAEWTQKSGRTIPVFLKIAPDVAEAELDDIVAEVLAQKLEGIIVSNTTLDRSALSKRNDEAGGLSGKPLFERSTIMLAKTRQRAGKELAIIGIGGVDSAETAAAKIQAGANLVQLYTGMIYQGPTLANQINRGLSALLDQRGISNISALRDEAVDDWAAKNLPS